MKKEMLQRFLLLLFVCYFVITGYLFLAFAKIDMADKTLTGIVFEALGVMFVFIFIVRSIVKVQNMKIGYLVPIVTYTVIYTLFMNVLNIWGNSHLPLVCFTLSHMIWAMIYVLVVIPMYIMGIQ